MIFVSLSRQGECANGVVFAIKRTFDKVPRLSVPSLDPSPRISIRIRGKKDDQAEMWIYFWHAHAPEHLLVESKVTASRAAMCKAVRKSAKGRIFKFVRRYAIYRITKCDIARLLTYQNQDLPPLNWEDARLLCPARD